MRINIQTKLMLLTAGLTATVLFGVLFSINQILSDRISQKILGDFKQTRDIFQREQGLRYERLVESAILIGENSTFKANLELGDPSSVYHIIDEFALFAKVDLFIVTDRKGRVLARLGDPDHYGDDLTHRKSIVRALGGEIPETMPEWPELLKVDHKLYQVATAPVYLADQVSGTITLGSQITMYEASRLKGKSPIDITFFIDDMLIASTIESLEREHTDAFLATYQKRIGTVSTERIPGNPFEAALKSVEVFAFVSPLGVGERAYYLASVPKSVELKILFVLQDAIFLVAGISLLMTLLLAFILGRTFSRPILRLVEGMNRVKQGDLSVSIEPSTRDEIGLLTHSYNEMVTGLRERLHLMKYVGTYTIDMIRETSGGEVALGGIRKELAVLFSDVRGFTPFSEKRTPKEAISMLNKHLGFQAEIVVECGGSVDKFVGDEMVALFNGEDAIERAIVCAIQIQRRMAEENKLDPVPIVAGIGINYGPMIMGNIGTKNRMDYTVIGAAVNLGARVCSAAKGGEILIPKELLQNLKTNFGIGKARMMSFKGISTPIEIANILSK